ncbi:MAG TPA: hypothetical protein VFF69_15100, partial [Phycisphaerales bacterium]|nr:hypothetical protein [Phycisphaerales bacterium]
MNSRHRAAIRFIAFGVLMAAAWIASARWGFCYQHRLSAQGSGPDFQTGISHGAFYFTYHPTNHFGMPRRWTLGPMSGRFRWWFKIWDAGPVNTGHRATIVPLWRPLCCCSCRGLCSRPENGAAPPLSRPAPRAATRSPVSR